jgi:alanine dehydrogenase
MFIGVPKEIKADEYRVSLTPATVKELTARGHRVAVETMAGAGAGIADQEYMAAGAQIMASADQIFQRAELIVKVKEPLASQRSNCAAARSSSPICIWLPMPSRPAISWHPV